MGRLPFKANIVPRSLCMDEAGFGFVHKRSGYEISLKPQKRSLCLFWVKTEVVVLHDCSVSKKSINFVVALPLKVQV